MAWLLLLWNRAFATTIELPEGEDPAVWVNPLALSGLGPEVDREAVVRFTASPAGWTLWVRDVDGAEHRVAVDPPVTRADRESLAALASSLVHPVSVPTVVLPELPPVVRRSAPAVVEVEPAVVEVAPLPAGPEPAPRPAPVVVEVPVDPPVVVVPEPAAEPRARATTWWAGGGPSLRMRPSVRTTVAGGAWAGLARGPWRLGAGIEVAAPAVLLKVETETRMTVADLRGTAVWAPGGWELGPTGGVSVRRLTTAASDTGLIPMVGGQLARRVPVGGVAVRIALLVERDLTPLDVVVQIPLEGEEDAVRIQPISAGFGVALWSR